MSEKRSGKKRSEQKQSGKRQSKFAVLFKMLGLVRPLSGYMCLAVTAGTLAYLAVQFIPVLGGYAILSGLGLDAPLALNTIWILLPLLALLRAILRFIEQRLNHYIAFTLLALVRDRVFGALRRLCPAKLEGRDKGDLVALITSDVELLEVFYAHTISPICIALIVETVMCVYIGTFHIGLGLLALAGFLCVGIVVPAIISGVSGNMGEKVRKHSADLSSCILENIRGLDETIQYDSSKNRMAAMRRESKTLLWHQNSLNRLTGLNLAGIGTNLGCYGSVIPTGKKMKQLAETAEAVEAAIGRQLEIVSGGATSSLMPVFDGVMPSKVNMLRIGGAAFVGSLEETCRIYKRKELEALHDDAITLEAEVIEVRTKPTHPIGELGVNAFGKKATYKDRGNRRRALLAIGGADFGDIGDILPQLEGSEVLGCSGDHTILDIEDCKEKIRVGDVIRFKLHYSAILNLSSSENVTKHEVGEIGVLL